MGCAICCCKTRGLVAARAHAFITGRLPVYPARQPVQCQALRRGTGPQPYGACRLLLPTAGPLMTARHAAADVGAASHTDKLSTVLDA
jgi:hypothetical protein